MPTTGAGKAKAAEIKEGGGAVALPRSKTIKIRNQDPNPSGKVEVAPWTGRVQFVNLDKKEYRLRFYRPNTEPLKGIDIVIAAGGRVTVAIKPDDEFNYFVLDPKGPVELGHGGGPIIN